MYANVLFQLLTVAESAYTNPKYKQINREMRVAAHKEVVMCRLRGMTLTRRAIIARCLMSHCILQAIHYKVWITTPMGTVMWTWYGVAIAIRPMISRFSPNKASCAVCHIKLCVINANLKRRDIHANSILPI